MAAASTSTPLFDCRDLRRAIAIRWNDETFQMFLRKKATEFHRKESSVDKSFSVLQWEIKKAIDEIRVSLEPKPWHDTLKFVSYDLPVDGEQFVKWTVAFAKNKENDPPAEERIMALVPGMKQHPETQTFMNEMILPFRTFVVSQVVSAVIDAMESEGGQAQGKDDFPREGKKRVLEEKDGMSEERLKESQQMYSAAKATAAAIHCSHHAKDLADVYYIDSLLGQEDKELKEHIALCKKNKICSRYAEYCWILMTLSDKSPNSEWIAKLEPLAKEGLAAAQFDLGCTYLKEKKEAEGLQWLERAGKLGHSKALLVLGKLFFSTFIKKSTQAPSPSSPARDKKDGPVNAQLRDLKNKKILMALEKQTRRWLEEVIDSDWDEETSKDIKEARDLLHDLDTLQQRFLGEERKKLRPPKILLWGLIAVAIGLTAIVWGRSALPHEAPAAIEEERYLNSAEENLE